ncbi:EF-hand domain-containing protein [Allorhizobium taibaishanense]|uniref:EF-hand domain-containing protein n=1 Tax=Allorhizobium taibaishanense TaxID=887144 RepID=A0A1Q8ZZD3_9HYPH|nr:EF-hand domain-containing protein [Allorhizobium taibaishanense]MBB4007399.1 hypothetical protein [Allorhizobium taibaishanense]OLP47636.1 hypothetical protein BJF91_04370 [Allorhizobium taibaishanense]
MTSVSSTSLSAVSSYNVGTTSSLDTNGDGVVSAEEQAAASTRTQDPTVLSDSAATGVSSQLSSDLMALVLSRGDASSTEDSREKSHFAAMDSDSDGKVTQSEFVANRPKEMSEDDATKLFEKLDSDKAGYLTEDQLKSDHDKARSQMMDGMGGSSGMPSLSSLLGSDSDSTSSDDSFTMDDVFNQMRSVIEAYRSAGGTADDTSTTDTNAQTASA